MKKSIIALAVAGALVAPLAQADATLYGSMRMYVNNGDGQKLDVSNDSSRIGIKGDVDTDIDGVKGIYRFEVDLGSGVTADQGESGFGKGRLAFVGLTGGFGTVAAGQQWTPMYSMVTGVTDMTINSTGEAAQVTFRKDSALAYVSPELGGFQAAAVIVADSDQDTGEDVDAHQLTAKYSIAGLTVAAGYHETEGQEEIVSFSGQYSMDALTVAAVLTSNDNTDADPVEVGASYSMGATTLVGTYYDKDNTADETGINLEVRHKLGKKFTVYANYENDDSNSGDSDSYGVGMRVDF